MGGAKTPIGAIVLAGGKASRLDGADKAGLEVGGRSMLDRVLTAVDGAGATNVVVVGPPRPVDRPATIFLQESVPGGGPVPAVAAGLSALPPGDQVVLLLAVDLPLLGSSHLALLLAAVDVDGVEAAAAVTHGRPNPLLAAYRREALLQTCGAGRANLPAWTLVPPATVLVELPEVALTNVNTPADLVRARRLATSKPWNRTVRR